MNQNSFIKKILFSIFCYLVIITATVDMTKNISLGSEKPETTTKTEDVVKELNMLEGKEEAAGEKKEVVNPVIEEKNITTTDKVEEKNTEVTTENKGEEVVVKENTEDKKVSNKYKYANKSIRVFADTKITPKAEDNLKISTRVEVLEKKTVDIIKNKTVKKADGKNEVQKIAIKDNWEKIAYTKNGKRKTGWIKENQLAGTMQETLPKNWKNLDFSPVEKKEYPDNKRVKVKGIYVTSSSASLNKKMDELIALTKRTKINAFVIDVKEDDGTLLFKMEAGEKYNPLANRRAPIKDIEKFMKRLKENNIYTIARIVSFKDPTYAKANPDKAIISKATGKPFTNSDGVIWVSPHDRYLWEYNVAVAKEAAKAGFDEIQFDYVRFPASNGGKLDKELNYRNTKNESKPETIQKYLAYARKELEPLGVYIAADVYGQVGSLPDDMALGQHWESVSNVVDYICPMIYPSHYGRGVYGLPVPDAYPYKTVYHCTQDSINRNANIDTPAMIRPWIQAFTAKWVKGHINYGPKEIELQVQALRDLGIEDYILWSPTNKYRIE